MGAGTDVKGSSARAIPVVLSMSSCYVASENQARMKIYKCLQSLDPDLAAKCPGLLKH
jgi:hypothetical protein